MQRLGACLRLAAYVLLAEVCGAATTAGARDIAAEPATREVQLAQLPPEAAQTLALIKRGGPFPYVHKDGAIFGNFEGRLPARPRGYYHEYTVPTPNRADRGPRRIVAGEGNNLSATTSDEFYYSGDHYRTFQRIRE